MPEPTPRVVPAHHMCSDFPAPSVRRHQCKACGVWHRLSSRTIGGVVYPQWLRIEPREVRKSA